MWSRRAMGVGLLALAGCGPSPRRAPHKQAPAQPPPAPSQRAGIVSGLTADSAAATRAIISFLEIAPGQRVVQLWPRDTRWAESLVPYLTTGGALTLATPDPAVTPDAAKLAKMMALDLTTKRLAVTLRLFGAPGFVLAPPASQDRVLFDAALPALLLSGYAELAFAAAVHALRPGGLLGVVQARAAAQAVQDPLGRNGYVQEAYVRALAADAGLTFDRTSDLLANPADERRPGGAVKPGADVMLVRFRKSAD